MSAGSARRFRRMLRYRKVLYLAKLERKREGREGGDEETHCFPATIKTMSEIKKRLELLQECFQECFMRFSWNFLKLTFNNDFVTDHFYFFILHIQQVDEKCIGL